jgi:glycosyltransferase involved in cell wall biosynthesis
MGKVSAIILTKNSEEQLADCIDSVRQLADEVIVIDDSSTDRTSDLAKHLGARVFDVKSDSFSEKRNFGHKKARNKWILYIDSDERVTRELRNSIKDATDIRISQYSAFKIKRKNFYFGKFEWPQIEEHLRLFNKNKLKEWQGKLHETPVIEGKIGELDGFLNHYTHQDLTSMTEKTIRWSQIEAELRYKANHPKMTWWRFFRVMLTAFYDSYFRQKGYRAGTAGLIESMYQSFSMFITYARLWEMQNKK